MKNKIYLFTLIAALLGTQNLNAQHKYALIFGSHDDGDSKQMLYSERSGNQQEAIWNDSYLMWELLLEKDFTNENIYFLYDQGQDYVRTPNSNVFDRYDPRVKHDSIIDPDVGVLTDMSANKANMQAVLTGFQTGSNGFPKLNPEDFLVVLIYGHGKKDIIITDPGNPAEDISSEEMHNWLNPLPCRKKIFINAETENRLTFSF